jgi:succinate dehydrogenase assembly factor 2
MLSKTINLITPFNRRLIVTGFTRSFALMTDVNQDLPQSTLQKILNVDNTIRTKYESIDVNVSDAEMDLVRRKRMIYRSKQRGWLEADLLMGSWAQENVPTLSKEDLDDYEELLKEETIDIYNYISAKDPLPEKLAKMPVMKRLQDYALASKVVSPESYAELKKKTNLT